MTNRGVRGSLWHVWTATLVLTVLAGSSCGEVGTEDQAISVRRGEVIGVDTFLYFRSNATGWDPNDGTRLRATSTPNVFDLVYDVRETWMVTSGDNAFFLETNQLNGWGTVQRFVGSSNPLVIVPAGGTLQGSNAFLARYPRLGKYRIQVNVAQNTFFIQEAARAWEPVQTATPLLTTIGVFAQSSSMMVAGYSNGDIFLTFSALSSSPLWTKIDAANLPNLPVNTLAINPRNNQEIFVGFAGRVQGNKVWKTVNGGQFWFVLPNAPSVEVRNISVNPVNPFKVYCIPESGVFVSDDGGDNWTGAVTADPLQPPLAAGDRITTVAVASSNLDNVWVGTTTGQIWVTFNASAPTQSWSLFAPRPAPGAGTPTRLITRLSPNPRNLQPPEVWATYAGLLDDSVWLTSTGGQFWVDRHNPDLPTTAVVVNSLAIYGVSVNPIDDNVVYANEFGANRSVNRGLSWTHFTF